MSDPVATIERLLADAEQLPDPQSRALVRALTTSLVDLVGASIGRVAEIGGPEVTRKLADDELVGNLMVLTNQHPDPPAVRAEKALAAAEKALGQAGVVLERVEPAVGGGVRVRVVAERGTTPDAVRVRELIDSIVVTRAPDVEGVHVDIAGEPSVVRLRVVS